ncbi:Protein unc-13-like protein 4B, partial [Frankliniella fusca]
PLQPGVWWPPDQRTHGKEHEDLYVEVLYTLANRVGSLGSHPSHGHAHGHATAPEDLHEYAMAAFGFNAEQHRRLLAVAREEKPPIVVLNVVVLEAEGLEAKDANGECSAAGAAGSASSA